MNQKKEIKREIMKYFVLNQNENSTYQNSQAAAKAILRNKFVALDAYIRKDSINQ